MRQLLRLLSFLLLILSEVECVTSPALLAAEPPKGALWVFAVGVSQYRNPRPPLFNLQYADNDAQALARALKDRSRGIFREVNTKVLVNQEANRQAILKETRAFFGQATPNDVALIAFMGHGVIEKKSGSYYFLPHPAGLENLSSEGLSLAEIKAEVRKVGEKVQRLILVIDTCHAAASRGGIKPPGISLGVGLPPEELKPPEGEAYTLSSSAEGEQSWEDTRFRLPEEEKGHGVFTYALLRGLWGEADTNQDGKITVLELFQYASRLVQDKTNGTQNPNLRPRGSSDFLLAEALPQAAPENSEKANALTQQGREYLRRGELDQAETACAQARALNPRDELPRFLCEQVKEEKAYRSDPRKQHDIIDQAKKLIEEYQKQRGSLPDDPWSPRPMVITFLNFETLGGGNERAGLHETLEQRIRQALEATKRAQVVERREFDAVLQQLQISVGGLADSATLLRVGRIFAARLIATGNIVYVSGYPPAVNLRMIDTETAALKINFSKDIKDPEKILATADGITFSILEQLRREYPIRGKILSVNGDEAILNIGAKHGTIPGMKMNALVEEPVTVNGQVVAQRKKEIGTLEISDVEEEVSFARVVERKGLLAQGTKVIETLTKEATRGSSYIDQKNTVQLTP